jgi:hypothetical protein
MTNQERAKKIMRAYEAEDTYNFPNDGVAAVLREVINQFEIKNEIESAYFNGWNACLKDIGILCDQLEDYK